MGLGKSAQAITAADAIGAKNVLILCPAVARFNWIREWRKFSSGTSKPFALLTGADAKRRPCEGVTICSYDLAANKGVLSSLLQTRWCALVLDEAHYLKNRKAKRTRAVLGTLAAKAERIWALSGTPTPNNPSELWPLCVTFGATKDGYWDFIKRFCTLRETPFGTRIEGGRNLIELKKLLAPFVLRRRKDEVLKDLPPLFYQDCAVQPAELDAEMVARYFGDYATPALRIRLSQEMAEQEALARKLLDAGDDDAANALETMQGRFGHLRQWTGLRKARDVAALVAEELDDGAYDKIVLFAYHRSVVKELETALKGYGAVLVDGSTPPWQRNDRTEMFQTWPTTKVFVGQIQAAGIAINLTAGHQVGVVEPSWTPAENSQAIMRCHRIGQTKPVTVRFFSIAGTVDERVQAVLRTKTRTITQLWGAV